MASYSARALIQGASRGLGLQFCRTLLSRRPDVGVVATCRNPDSADALHALKSEPGNGDRLRVLQLDVTQEDMIKEAAGYVDRELGGLDLLINCAALLHPSGRGETSLRDVNMQTVVSGWKIIVRRYWYEKARTTWDLIQTCSTNAFGPLLMAKHFGKLLGRGSGTFGVQTSDVKTQHAGVLVNISAKVGSITDNGLGGWYAYRMSKAALNMATKNVSLELGRGRKRVICTSLHPGTVDTELSAPYHKNVKTLFSTEQSVDKLLRVIDSLTVEDSGKFFTYDKELLPF